MAGRWRARLAALLAALATSAAGADAYDDRFGADAAWYRARVPLFESSDAQLDAVWDYRWRIVRAHQRDLGARGFITTEFLDDVPWQREPYASLNDATGFHLGELRWLRDRRYAADYLDYMLTGGDDRHFTDYLADSVWGRYLVDGDRAEALKHLSALRYLYGAWDDHRDFARGLYWIEPLLDATEYTISSIDASGGKDGFRGGDAFRPSINSYMFAQARALARLTALTGDRDAAADYAARAEAIRARVQTDLWNPALRHFADRYKAGNEHVRAWDFVRGRELAGYVPWAFDLPADDPLHAEAWRALLSPDELAGPYGLRTVGPSYQYYMRQYRYEGANPECQWNGPVWPFQTTQALAGMINLLDHYHQAVVVRADFWRLLRQYAALHRQGDRLDLEEDYDPATGKPIVGLARSHHYFHSGFIDLVMTGVVGLRPRADDVLELNPLVPVGALAWFEVAGVRYHGRDVAVRWDTNGSHYRQGRGLTVLVDGRQVARAPTLARIAVPLARRPADPIARPIDQAVQLVRGGWPRASASSNAEAEALHDAIDGRVWFFPEAKNGWESTGGSVEWFALDFAQPTTAHRAELAFLAGGDLAAPTRVAVQRWTGSGWADLAAAKPLANGVTNLSWPSARAARLRVRMTGGGRGRFRLVEWKLF